MLKLYGMAALVLVLACLGAYGMGIHHANVNCEKSKQLDSHNALVESINKLADLGKDFAKAGSELAVALRDSGQNTKVVIKTVKERIDAAPSDPVCVLPADDVRLWNEQVRRVGRAVDRAVPVRDPGE